MANGKKSRGTWAQATRDIVIRLIATGQLPVGIFGAAVLLMVYKTPNEHMVEVWATLALFIKVRAGLGYLLAVVISGSWYAHARFQRRNAEDEIKRLSTERTGQQQKSFAKGLGSSKE
jgi:hypothetical protein